MKVSWCALGNDVHYFIEKESLDNPGKMVRWDTDLEAWTVPGSRYTRFLYQETAECELDSLSDRKTLK